MKKTISTIILLTVFVANNFMMVSQANASFLKAGINALSKGATVTINNKKKTREKINFKIILNKIFFKTSFY
jgi:invasion protein IalB